MGLSDKREAMLKELPIIKSEVKRSKDGKWLMHVTRIVHIKPVKYYKAVIENAGALPEEHVAADELARLEAEA